MKKYKELNQIDRYEIQILKEKGYSIRKIAKILKKVRKKQTALLFSRSRREFLMFLSETKKRGNRLKQPFAFFPIPKGISDVSEWNEETRK